MKIETYWTFFLYLQVIIQFLQGYSRMMSSASRERISQRLVLLGYCSWFILPAILIIGIMPLIAIAYPAQSNKLCMVHVIGAGLITFFYGFICSNCLSFLLKELKIYVKNLEGTLSTDIKLVVFRLTAAYIVIVGSSAVFGILYVVFGSADLLFHLMAYFQLFTCACVPPQTFILVITVARVSHSDSNQVVPTATTVEKI